MREECKAEYHFTEDELCEVYKNIVRKGWDDRLGKCPDYKSLDRWWTYYEMLKESIERVIPVTKLLRIQRQELFEAEKEYGDISADREFEDYFLNSELETAVSLLHHYCEHGNDYSQPRTNVSPFKAFLRKLGIGKKC